MNEDLRARLEKAARATDTEIYYNGYPSALLQEAADALAAPAAPAPDEAFWQMLGDALKSGGMYDPAFLAGMVQARAGLPATESRMQGKDPMRVYDQKEEG